MKYLRDPKTSRITGLIVKNSWGTKTGLDVNAQLPAIGSAGGYYLLTEGYLKQALQDFVIEKDLANQPKYRHRFQAN